MWLDFAGMTTEELKENIWSLIHPDDVQATSDNWSHLQDDGISIEHEQRFKHKSGEYRWHLSKTIAHKDADGNITMYIGSNTDIHDQKIIAEALKQSEHYFRLLADETPFMIWKVDHEGICNYVNKSWSDFTGISFNESVGLGWSRAFHEDDRKREYTKFLNCFKENKPYHSKFRLRRKDGIYRWMLAVSNPISEGNMRGYIGSLTDITDQQMLQQATEELMRKKDEFMSIASHELKTPITSMKASLQIIERLTQGNTATKDVHSFIAKATRHANKLTALVNDLLDVTKIQAGKIQFNFNHHSIGEIITDSLDHIRNTASRQHIMIDGDTSIKIFGDKHRLEQVLNNFLSNAVKYSPPGSPITLTITAETNQLKVSVRDEGIGIPEDKMKYVFDRFFRVQESSQKFAGLGLGLYISAEIVRRHGGEVGVESKGGNGSTFWFTIPMDEV